MKFALCNETFADWPLTQALEFTAECGYTGIELAPFTLASTAGELTSAQREAIRRQIEDAGLACIGLHWLLAGTEGYHLTSPDADTRRRTADYFAELARLCRNLGGEVLVLGSPKQRSLLPGVSQEEAFAFAADVLSAAMPTFEQSSVTLALEPLGPQETDFLTTADQAAALIAEVGSPYCRLQLDAKALAAEADPPDEIIRRHGKLLAHFHANDPNLRGPGMGELDLTPHLAALAAIDYRGWVSVEVFDYSPGPQRLARESIEYLQRISQSILEE